MKTGVATLLAAMTLWAVMTLATVAHAQGPVATGSEFQVNSYTTDRQGGLSVAGLTDGGFVAAWSSLGSAGSDSSLFSIQARRFDAESLPVSEDFQVNTYTPGTQSDPALAVLDDGDFMVVWGGEGGSGSPFGSSVQGRLFAPDATPLGDQFLISSYTSSSHSHPDVATLDDGSFVTVWRSSRSPSDAFGFSIQGQLLHADGSPAGGQFMVNSYVTGSQSFPRVAARDGGGFVVVWESSASGGSDADRSSIQGRLFAADGLPVGEDFQVNAVTVGDQLRPSVATLKDGSFIVAWHGAGPTGSDVDRFSVQARHFAADGSAEGGQFQVNATTSDNQWFISVAPWADGFVAAWQSDSSSGSDMSGSSIQVRSFVAGDMRLGGDFQANSWVADDQFLPAVAPLADDGFLVGWGSLTSAGSDSSASSLQGQRFVDPRFALANARGGCLAADGEPADGTPVVVADCDGSEAQRWWLYLSRTFQQIVGPGGYCLSADPAEGYRVFLAECDGNERWRIRDPEHGQSSIVSHDETGRCLEGGIGSQSFLVECHGMFERIWRPVAETCTPDSVGLCLAQERYRVDVIWRSFDGTFGSSRVVPRVSSVDSGLLWFFEADNWEMLIKVLDGCAINDHFWVFAAATTNVEYTMTVTDTATGRVRRYFNPLGRTSPAITDTTAFDTCSVDAARSSQPPVRQLMPVRSRVVPSPEGVCVPSATRLCLSDDFAVEVTWADGVGGTGPGRVVAAGSDATGLFWFFDPNNWEMLVKVLDGCAINDRFWLLAAATTDVEYTLRVTDLNAGVSREYFNPLGQASPAVIDTFATCPDR